MGLQAQLVLSCGDEKQWDGNVLRWLEPAVLHSRCGMGGGGGVCLYACMEPSHFERNQQLVSWLSTLLTGVKQRKKNPS